LLPISFDAEPPEYTEYPVHISLHQGQDRPHRLAIWAKASADRYKLWRMMQTDEEATGERFRPPTLITPKGQPAGEDTQFLYIIKDRWRGVDETLFAVDSSNDDAACDN
jgi:hypothetical protein